MAYIDKTFYLDTYLGTNPGNDDAIAKAIARASRDIDYAAPDTIYVDLLNAATLTLLKEACAAQAEWYIVNGYTFNDPLKAGGVSIGGFSEQTNPSQLRAPMELCPRARAALSRSGLLFAGVKVR